ncbi:MAG: urease accessory protein UreF [Flaviflexus sp.]|nr:urease accessory protein UreF [Flaviflexus sp.]
MLNTLTKGNLVLWQLTDSALPTGSFAHSAGMETYIQDGKISNARTFQAWLARYLDQTAYTDGLLVRMAIDMVPQWSEERLLELDELARAVQIPAQIRKASAAMGKRMATIAEILLPEVPVITRYAEAIRSRQMSGHPAIAFGLVIGALGIDRLTGIRAYFMQVATSMTQNAIRGIPLGQDAGQRVLTAMHGPINRSAERTLDLDDAELGATLPGLEVAQMRHEGLHSRMFIS